MASAQPVKKVKELRATRIIDPLWWCVSMLLGVACAKGPAVLGITEAQGLEYVQFGGFFLCGVFLGFVYPKGAWRWGLAMLLAMPLLEVLKIPELSGLIRIPLRYWVSVLQVQGATYATHGAVAFFGTYMGAYMNR